MSSDGADTRSRILEAAWRLLEERRSQGVRMGDIARAAGVSRQALYLHFASRTELMVALVAYVDEVKGAAERLKSLEAIKGGVELLDKSVEAWAAYIPEIYSVAKALMHGRDDDEALAAAWNDAMGCLRDVCQNAIEALKRDGALNAGWSGGDAVDTCAAILSVQVWEQLTLERGWSSARYVKRMKELLRSALVAAP